MAFEKERENTGKNRIPPAAVILNRMVVKRVMPYSPRYRPPCVMDRLYQEVGFEYNRELFGENKH